MKNASEVKNERLQMRLDTKTRNMLQRAANYGHKTLSQFVLSTAVEEAERIIKKNEVVTLSGPDWTVFYDALTNPPQPNAALRKAFECYKTANK